MELFYNNLDFLNLSIDTNHTNWQHRCGSKLHLCIQHNHFLEWTRSALSGLWNKKDCLIYSIYCFVSGMIKDGSLEN